MSCAVNCVFVFLVEFNRVVVTCGRNEQGEAVEAEQAFHGILPGIVGDFEFVAQINNFVCAEAKFGAEHTAQFGGMGGFELQRRLRGRRYGVCGCRISRVEASVRRVVTFSLRRVSEREKSWLNNASVS